METLLTAVVPAFALIAIGYGAARFKLLGGAIFPVLNNFVYYLAMPALMIVSLAAAPVGEILNWNFIAAFVLGIAVTWLMTGLAGRFLFADDLAGSTMRGVIASYGNNGYLGIPLAAAAFGAAPFGPPPEPTTTGDAADAPAADPFAADPFGAPPPDPAVS